MTNEVILQKLAFDLESRGRSIETIKEYTSKLRLFQNYYGKPADQMGEKECRADFVALKQQKSRTGWCATMPSAGVASSDKKDALPTRAEKAKVTHRLVRDYALRRNGFV